MKMKFDLVNYLILFGLVVGICFILLGIHCIDLAWNFSNVGKNVKDCIYFPVKNCMDINMVYSIGLDSVLVGMFVISVNLIVLFSIKEENGKLDSRRIKRKRKH